MTALQAAAGLPYWSAKQNDGFRKVYEVQLTRSERRNRMLQESLKEASTLMDGKLSTEQEQKLSAFVWKWDGKEIEELKDIKKVVFKDGQAEPAVGDQALQGRAGGFSCVHLPYLLS
ncbi:hypothetical protein [Halodesulfovibrio sp.]|jgi:hypothetical protein|uniref:hypothetical protein n=1 Tax=Halodesulfovibrio sp. TaxID=1912772 RepID=UPI0025DB0161|nr:hypothetical protein [Halodesulfovibrio sp.]MCT4626450.1 hypothetical protein [Halodesulfovibrio sp.]